MKGKSAVVTILLCLSITISAGWCQGEEGGKHFLWKVSSPTATAYLFGSIHLAKPDIYPLSPVIEESFAKAAVLAVEADPAQASDSALQLRMLQSATYAGEGTLQSHLTPKTYELVAREMGKAGLPPAQFARVKPWFLAMTLELLELGKLGYDPAYGLDRHFAEESRGKKKLVELESFDYQIKVLDGFSDREQELFLLYTIKDLATLGDGIADLMRAWRTGDAAAMEELMMKTIVEYPDARPIYETLLNRRNREMAGKVEKMLRARETTFVVVGAAHLVGKEGIISLLKGKGFSVEQL